MKPIWIVDDDESIRWVLEKALARENLATRSFANARDAVAALEHETPQVLVSDIRMPGDSGLDLLQLVKQRHPGLPVIIITAFSDLDSAVAAFQGGAFEYLAKPFDIDKAVELIRRALDESLRESSIESGPADTPEILGQAPAMQEVFRAIGRLSQSNVTVLITGESGTGKELVARAIHDVSARRPQPFIAVNCGAIPEQLLEAEFFGYRKGAFTGASEDREGFFQAAQGGTLFLDEIGDLPLAMQSKLLRALQERSVRPVGAVAEMPVNVRLLSATHKDLAAEVAGGRFRQDLYYRLNVIQIRVPPLRERMEDLAPISARILQRIAADAGVAPVPALTPAALATLSRYSFPGNVRELENLLHRALALSSGDGIDLADLGLPDSVLGLDDAPAEPGDAPAEPPLGAALPAEARGGAPLPADLATYLDEVEKQILLRALEQHRNNRTAAGASLGLSLRQMRYRMARLEISVGGDES